ncbi:hypothetical protein [Sphingomonas nostoxanthinifaciens]|uniref:hypothetical protein n=1 Tax=Sphingomonas nostoxanthinifaciens TaxID=2872652 RepID=UPI001CC1C38C|nr:hypothetical protein [Sphingomonas nostoxanthinifaciens]UAK23913.1 hypothetical protein K8P63_16330 [Sphingomonas nostoxanthinifaciens]
MARLDRAIERIERAGNGRDFAGAELAERYVLLEERHGLLRDRVQQTIERLDTLIGGGS